MWLLKTNVQTLKEDKSNYYLKKKKKKKTVEVAKSGCYTVVVIIIPKVPPTESEHSICTGWNPTSCLSEVCNNENF